MKGQTPSPASTLLAARVRQSSEPCAVVDAVIVLLGEMHDALAPILGSQGVAALYKRSLFVAAQGKPHLAGLHDSLESRMDLSALQARLNGLAAAEATAAGDALIQTFHQVLESLVGTSLTERLLRSLWDRPLSDPPTLEPTP